MLNFFLECAIRAALIVGGTALVLRLLRVRVASVRHRVWLAVLLLMLALPLWTAWGPKAELRLLPASVERFASPPTALPAIPTADATQPIAAPAQTTRATHRLLTTTEEILLGIYLFGLALLFTRLMIGTIKARRLIHDSSPCENLSSRIPDALGRGEGSAVCSVPPNKDTLIRTTSQCAAPVTVGCFHPTILLPGNWRSWPGTQLAVVLAHESEHVRRRDPLVQWLALFNRAIFWFHPAAWWLERELSALAEESCDAAVLAQGHDPGDYAETLMNIARDVTNSGSRINSMAVSMPGPRLPRRMHKIVEGGAATRITRLRVAATIAACAAVCAAFAAGTLIHAQSVSAAAWEQAAGGHMEFEVASVKPRIVDPMGVPKYNVPLGIGDNFAPTGGILRTTNISLVDYVVFAYKLTYLQLRAVRSQLPKWATAENFDIEARAAGNPTKDQYRLMMQSLLADRFKLALHFEAKDEPVLALVLAKPGKLGPHIRLHPGDGPPCTTVQTFPREFVDGGFPRVCGMIDRVPTDVPGEIKLAARNIPLSMWTSEIGYCLFGCQSDINVNRPVVDQTGIAGNVDLTLEYLLPLPATFGGHRDTDDPTFLEALNDQLGMKLEQMTAPVDSIVIDHVEEPTPN